MSLTVLVTGGTGFVGLHLVRRLLAAGARVVVLSQDDLDPVGQQFLEKAPEPATFVRADVRDRQFLLRVAREERADRFVHAAAVTPSPEVEREAPAAIIDVNLSATVNLLEAARECRARRVVLLSSSGVYGRAQRADEPITEEAPLQPSGLYSICKIAGEHLGRHYATLYDLSVVSARVGTVYGPLERPMPSRTRMSEVHTLVHAALAGTGISVFGADVPRDFCYAEDVGVTLARLALSNALRWDVYNVGSGAPHTVRDLATLLARLVPGFVWRAVDNEPEADLVVPASKARRPLDCSRAFRDLQHEPQNPLRSGLTAYMAWLGNASSGRNV